MKARRPITRRARESDSTPNLNRNGQNATSNDGNGEDGSKSKGKTVFQLSIPGALQCLHHEFGKYEIERSKWAADKAELDAKVAFLKGQLKGQERLVHDLVCRIKMLEYSLKEERGKYHKLKYGTELKQSDVKPPEPDNTTKEDSLDDEDFKPAKDWRQGRQLLRQYLSEIGYTEAVVNVNSYRINSLLHQYNSPHTKSGVTTQGVTTPITRPNDLPKTRESPSSDYKPIHSHLIMNSMIPETDAEIMAKFDFLPLDDDADDEREENEDTIEHPTYDHISNCLKGSVTREGDSDPSSPVEAQWMEAWPMEHTDDVLGDLAYLNLTTVTDHSDYLSWKIKYMLRGHFDSIRGLAFHPVDPLLATASEDHTVNIWNLEELASTKLCEDLKPLHTFRGHECQVMCVIIGPTGEWAFSGGFDGSLLCWDLPGNKDGVAHDQVKRLEGHTDVVWGLSHQLHGGRTTLLSCSSDGSVKLWAPNEMRTSLSRFCSQEGECPTSVDFVRAELNQMVTSYDNGECILYDLEYGKPLVWLEMPKDSSGGRINRVVSHPVMPVTVSVGDDGQIRFFDNTSGQLVQTIAGHRDSISSVAIDRYGMYMLTGSHDRTVCVWDVRAKNRIQQIYTHGKKFEESVLDVAFHHTLPLIGSAGADGYAQVFKPT